MKRNRAFAVGRFEVTFTEWDACVSAGGCGGHRPGDEGWGRDRRPVVNVSWDDAKAYVSWISQRTGKSYRLLTEAEWEYVERAGTTSQYSWGERANDACLHANGFDLTTEEENSGWTTSNCADGFVNTAPVGSFEPNGFGLHDLNGNAFEWVEDCWNDSHSGSPTNGSARQAVAATCESRVVRGGSWISNPQIMRAANRGSFTPGIRSNYLGFRLARTINP